MTDKKEKEKRTENVETLMREVHDMKEDVSAILTILRGDKYKDKPEGLIYSVSRNTRFRKLWTKVIWFAFATNAGILVWILIEVMGG